MGTKVKIRTLVAEAGPYYSWPAGKVVEVDEDEARGRIADGRAEPVDKLPERHAVNRAGQPLETAAVSPATEQREDPSEIIDAMLNLLPDAPPGVVDALIQAGYDSIDDLAAASDSELKAVEGVGPATVKKIRAAVAAWHD